VGLGNPGPEYVRTRHNAGFSLIDHIAANWQLPAFRRDRRARVTSGRHGDHDVGLIKPHTYMNRSGAALAPLTADPEFDASQDLLVLVDDAALPLGRFRLRPGGSAGGHNGLKSIQGALRSQEYARLRIGVGPVPTLTDDLADFVLEPMSAEDVTVLEHLLDPMTEAVDTWVSQGIDAAMNRFNRSLEEM
jgi:PTH1 family peptidyl-tRNA hydrolase